MDDPGPETGDERRLRRAIATSATFVAVLWLIQLDALAFDLDLVPAGIYPRRAGGLVGIALAPLIHASFAHLFANSLPLLVIGTAMLYGYPRAARVALPALYAGTGLGVWLFARSAYHVGASGLATGMMVFVFTLGTLRWDRRAIALSMIVFFLYGGMIWGIFPADPRVSHESHLFGALLGLVSAILSRDIDPPPPEKRYDWEQTDTPPEDTDAPADRDGAGPAAPS